jgi:hypothetical protein
LAGARAVSQPLPRPAVLVIKAGLPVSPAGLHHPLLRHGSIWIAKAELPGLHPSALHWLLSAAALICRAALSVSETVLHHPSLLHHRRS